MIQSFRREARRYRCSVIEILSVQTARARCAAAPARAGDGRSGRCGARDVAQAVSDLLKALGGALPPDAGRTPGRWKIVAPEARAVFKCRVTTRANLPEPQGDRASEGFPDIRSALADGALADTSTMAHSPQRPGRDPDARFLAAAFPDRMRRRSTHRALHLLARGTARAQGATDRHRMHSRCIKLSCAWGKRCFDCIRS